MIIFAAVIGTTAMVGVIGYLVYRIRALESGMSAGSGSGRLVEQVNLLREDLLTVQEETAALSERVEFTERLLMDGEADDPGA